MARRALAALLLVVLAVVGGAPAAVGAGPAPGPSAGVPPSAAYPPGARQPTPHTDRTTRTGSVPESRRARTAVATDGHRPGPVTGPRPEPRAGADHVRAPHQIPPPGPEALLPGAPAVRVPHVLPRPAPAGNARTTDRLRAALPGVRGPPGTPVHRSSVPVPTPDRPPVPSR